MIVQGGIPVSFNYGMFDRATGKNVAGSIYDVSSGSPAFVSKVAMTEIVTGVYEGSFTPVAGKAYLVVCAVYTDIGYTTPDTTRSPSAQQIYAETSFTLLSCVYAAFDQNAALTVSGTVYNLTDNINAPVTMAHVALGVYFGQYVGTLNKSYLVYTSPSDTTYAPSVDSFQSFGLVIINNLISAATLSAQNPLPSGKIAFTQSDVVDLDLYAKDGSGNAVNLLAATFESEIRKADGTVLVLPDSQHVILDSNNGRFKLSLSADDTSACGANATKDIITKITQGGSVIHYRGIGLLSVYVADPLQ